ncbi:MAG: nuclear transport factor 2 family protein, partial [Alphaproteobacteria bacterium]|nr:nuclear transport factor 2 family protein [Alphaproteobacteria bacterium]
MTKIRSAYVAVLMGMLATTALAQANETASASSSDADKAAIRKSEQIIATATSVDEVLPLYDKNVILDDFTPGRRHGLTALRKEMEGFFQNYTDAKGEILSLDIESDGKLAFANSTQHITAKGKNGMPDLDIALRQTDCYRKENGRWL